MIEVKVLREAGHEEALLGMSFSHGLHKKDIDPRELESRKRGRALKLAHMQGGHNKFLESIIVWLDVRAPRYWWQQADTYRMSTKQSESTMHTIMKRKLTQLDFYEPIPDDHLHYINEMIESGGFERVKRVLPESFMQRRIWCLSYKTIQNMYLQRKGHKLAEWHDFLNSLIAQLEHCHYIVEIDQTGGVQ